MREFKDNRSGIIMRSHGYDHSFFEGMQESLIKSEKEEQHAKKVFQDFIQQIGYLHFTTFDGTVAAYSRIIEGCIRIWWSEHTRLQSSTNPKVGDKIIVVHGEIHEEKPLRLCCYEVVGKAYGDLDLREIEVKNVIFKDKNTYEAYIEPYERFAVIKKVIEYLFIALIFSIPIFGALSMYFGQSEEFRGFGWVCFGSWIFFAATYLSEQN